MANNQQQTQPGQQPQTQGSSQQANQVADTARAAIQDALGKLPQVGRENYAIKSGDPPTLKK